MSGNSITTESAGFQPVDITRDWRTGSASLSSDLSKKGGLDLAARSLGVMEGQNFCGSRLYDSIASLLFSFGLRINKAVGGASTRAGDCGHNRVEGYGLSEVVTGMDFEVFAAR